MLPSIFVSHGSPMLSILNNKTTKFLKELPLMFDKPKYILVISAHWTTNKLEILSNHKPFVLYDFHGFPKELYEQEYKASSKEFHDWVIERLKYKEEDELINFIHKAPFVHKNHPTLEHFLPFFITLGSSSSKKGESLHDFYIYGNQSMNTILFKE
jgi:aromatic ring-opening dioxygenase catalytic subunit (LigB family)